MGRHEEEQKQQRWLTWVVHKIRIVPFEMGWKEREWVIVFQSGNNWEWIDFPIKLIILHNKNSSSTEVFPHCYSLISSSALIAGKVSVWNSSIVVKYVTFSSSSWRVFILVALSTWGFINSPHRRRRCTAAVIVKWKGHNSTENTRRLMFACRGLPPWSSRPPEWHIGVLNGEGDPRGFLLLWNVGWWVVDRWSNRSHGRREGI